MEMISISKHDLKESIERFVRSSLPNVKDFESISSNGD